VSKLGFSLPTIYDTTVSLWLKKDENLVKPFVLFVSLWLKTGETLVKPFVLFVSLWLKKDENLVKTFVLFVSLWLKEGENLVKTLGNEGEKRQAYHFFYYIYPDFYKSFNRIPAL
jgi:hypothetical protein